ncbi:UvrD-helicase domain-containing protein [Vibrio fluvialis]|nr:UvrD-helicase domain-containing protein [Vibrio fluvialis]
MIEFTEEQKNYIQSEINRHVFLEACPGSGKTEIVAAKVAKEVSSWTKFPGGMAVLSFANSATDELKDRVRKYLPAGSSLFPHFLGTFDSFIYKNIVNPLSSQLTGYKGKNGDYSIKIVDNASNFFGFKTKYKIARQGHIYAHQFSINQKDSSLKFKTGNTAVDHILDSHPFEDWQIRDLLDAKSNMWSSGFATYGDIEYLAIDAMTDRTYTTYVQQLSQRYPLIIVDECQDLCFEQLVILQKLSDAGVKLHFIGDLHQAIYGFRDVDPQAVKQFVVDNNFLNLELTRNFRSCQKIINLCGKLIGRSNIIGQVTQLEPVCYIAQYNNCPTELTTVFQELCEGYNNTVIVSRGHSLLRKFNTLADNLKPIHKLALAVKLFDDDDMEALERSITLFSEFLRHYIRESVKPNSFNCPQSIESNLVWRKFLFSSIIYLKNNKLDDMDINWSTWVNRAKTSIRTLSTQKFINDEVQSLLTLFNTVNLSAPKGQAKQVVKTSLGNTTDSGSIHRKTTIHGAKGETHDITILLSTPDGRGSSDSHWRNWLSNPSSEAARFAYVASSRPKYRLIWAVKNLKAADKKIFTDMGFHIL